MLLCLAVYVPGLASIPVIDRDEARFAQASRQMLESGDWVMPRVQDRPRLNKPPLIYWLQAGTVWAITGGDVSRDAIWMYRVPSVAAATLAVLITWGFAWRMSGPSVAFLAGSLLAVCPLVAFDAHQARADQLLLACTTWTMGSLWVNWRDLRAGRRARIGWLLTLWAGVAAGVMAKGPITPLVLAMTVVALSAVDRSWRWIWGLRPVMGAGLVVLAVAPWVWAVAKQVGFSEYVRLVWEESAGRAGGSKEGHFGPPGMHTVLLLALFWPGMLTTARAVKDGLREGWPKADGSIGGGWRGALKGVWRRRLGKPHEAYLLAWAGPAWVFFELFGAKLAHYPMPLYPAIAILSARAGVSFAARGERPTMLDLSVWAGVGTALGLAVAGMGVAAMMGGWAPMWLAVMGVVSGLAGMGLAAPIVRAGRPYERLLRRGRWAMIVMLPVVFTLGRPAIPGDDSARIMDGVRRVAGWETRPLASTHKQDSMVFQTRGRVSRLDPGEIAGWLAKTPKGLAVVAKTQVMDPSWRVVGGVNRWTPFERDRDPMDETAEGWWLVERVAPSPE